MSYWEGTSCLRATLSEITPFYSTIFLYYYYCYAYTLPQNKSKTKCYKLLDQMLAPDWSNFTRDLEGSLTSALGRYLDDWRNNATAASDAVDKALAEENFSNVLLYLMVMIGMLAFIIVAMLVSTVKSRRKEHSNDLYHQYIKDDWTAQIQQGDIFTNASAR